MRLRATHTVVEMEVCAATFAEIRQKLVDAGYGHSILVEDGRETLDMSGIALAPSPWPYLRGAEALATLVTEPAPPGWLDMDPPGWATGEYRR